MTDYLPILIFALLAAALPLATIFLAKALQTRKPNTAKLEPYECGIEPSSFALDTRFSVRYFLIAVLFVVFDVETIFLFPWAVMFNRLGLFGLIEMLIFLVILVVGYFYLAGGLVIPGYVLLPLWAVWALLAWWLVTLARRNSWWTPLAPVAAAVLFVLVITVGEQVLGWRG